ncbi:hypothetical protein [Sphingobacterium athyrii]|uniref:Uncharacterized protein n=1 Tax=Sphingobacterium athyrii TaxID=2152717 RepID=A0A363NUN9_9SPHI|nr:hypothetical protein [Sphingobacterium athyrii]PUV24535.1 hypothetical protein DCO56_14430 [Sphingobacterium athyrii]
MTAQLSDILHYQGNAHSMCNEPLSKYLNDRPIKFVMLSTALNRGYRAGWLLSENKLYLIDLKAHLDHDNYVGLDYLFPQQEKVFADWYSGTIKINQGDLIKYVHSGYGSVYQRSVYLVIEKGRLINEYVKNNNSLISKARRILEKLTTRKYVNDYMFIDKRE